MNTFLRAFEIFIVKYLIDQLTKQTKTTYIYMYIDVHTKANFYHKSMYTLRIERMFIFKA